MINSAEDNAIRDILLDAAASEFAAELSDVNPVETSIRFQKRMETMLINPQRWAKRLVQPLWKKCIQTAAAILLVCSLSLGALMAVSPTVRAAVINWVTEWYETYVIYRFSGETTENQIVPMPQYTIADLPAGYNTEGELLELPNNTEIVYGNEAGQMLRLEYIRMVAGHALMIRTENMVITDASINNCIGQLYISTDSTQSNAVVWIDEQANLQFMIDGFVGEQELLHMAESVSLANLTK